MCVKTIEQGKFKDVPIKEGEAWVLPGHISHSPQVLSRQIKKNPLIAS